MRTDIVPISGEPTKKEGRSMNDADAKNIRNAALKEAADAVLNHAGIFDFPSVYMGGPSFNAKRKAKEVAKLILQLTERE